MPADVLPNLKSLLTGCLVLLIFGVLSCLLCFCGPAPVQLCWFVHIKMSQCDELQTCVYVIMLLLQSVGGRSLSARCASPPALCRFLRLLVLLTASPRLH